jgi:hypothetical protein
MEDLSLRNQILDGARHVLDGNLWVDAVLVKQIDVIGPVTLQHSVNRKTNMFGAAVEPAK